MFVTSGPAAQAHAVGAARANTNFSWTADGQLIGDQGNVLTRIDPATGSKSAITPEEGKAAGDFSACADGRYTVFELLSPGTAGDVNIWRADASGGNLKQLTTGKRDTLPLCSGDSRWAYYIDQKDEATLARVAIDGGTPQSVSNLAISDSQFDVSPDGKWAAFATLEHALGHKDTLVLVNTETGQTKKLDFERLRLGLIRFSHDGKAVVYPTRENGVDNLWSAAAGWIEGKTDHGFHFRTHLRFPLVVRWQAAWAGARPYRLRCGFDPRCQAVRSAVIFYPKIKRRPSLAASF